MNILPFSAQRICPRILMAGWMAMGFLVSTAAQVKPPNAQDMDGNRYAYPVLIYESPHRKSGLEVDPRRTDSVVAAIQQKMDKIIIPHLKFHDTPLSGAIEFIRQQSRRLDLDPDTDNRGLNIFLKLPKDAATSRASVTAELTDVPVLEALKFVAEKVGLKVKVEPYAVSLVPLSENTDPMITAEFRVPRKALDLLSGKVWTPPGVLRPEIKTMLESVGITFPPGASAAYLSAPGKLVVRNTQENIDRIESEVTPLPANP